VSLPDRLFEGSSDDLSVTLEVEPSAASLLADYIPAGAVTTTVNGRLRTTIRVPHYHGLKRLMASMAGVARVVEPAEARRAVAQWAGSGAERYTD
jgi:proteasome accessory factor C